MENELKAKHDSMTEEQKRLFMDAMDKELKKQATNRVRQEGQFLKFENCNAMLKIQSKTFVEVDENFQYI